MLRLCIKDLSNSADTEQVQAGHSESENIWTCISLPANWTRLDIEILLGKQVLCVVVGYQKKKRNP